MQDWTQTQCALEQVAQRQVFFIGGAPRSGTTWLQHLLDFHPRVSCAGEALFFKELAVPLDRLMAARGRAIEAKNAAVFKHSGGYAPPGPGDGDVLLRTAILLALQRQSAGKACDAVGEKTPENVFFFPRLKHLFPAAKFIGIARDPRDVLTSAWHFFQRPASGGDEQAAKTEFVRAALPALDSGARAMIALAERHPADCLIVTYEALRGAPAETLARLFAFVGVAAEAGVVEACLARGTFAAMAGRPAGVGRDGSFFRKGVSGDWASTLPPALNEMVLRDLGWMFPVFGWPR